MVSVFGSCGLIRILPEGAVFIMRNVDLTHG